MPAAACITCANVKAAVWGATLGVITGSVLKGCTRLYRTFSWWVDWFKKTPQERLACAARLGNLKEIQRALKEGADVNSKEAFDLTALVWAAGNGHVEVTQALLDAGADINAMLRLLNDECEPEFYEDLLQMTPRMVQSVLDRAPAGFSVNEATEDAKGFTALHLAARFGHAKVVAVLLNARADVNRADKHRTTSIHLATRFGHKEVAAELLQRGADATIEDRQGCTPLHLAADKGLAEMVSALLEGGASPYTSDSDGWMPGHKAASTGSWEIVQMLLDKGIDPDAATNGGWTLLHCAAHGGHKEVLQILLDRGAKVDAVDLEGWTALHCAANCGRARVVEILISAGSNPALETTGGMCMGSTAGDLARRKKHHCIADFLQDAAQIKRVLTVAAARVSEDTLRLTCTTIVGNVAAVVLWNDAAPVHELPAAIIGEVRKAGFTGLKEPLGAWNLTLLKPGSDPTPVAVDHDSPPLAKQYGLA